MVTADIQRSEWLFASLCVLCSGKEAISTGPRIRLISASRQHNDARSASIVNVITNNAQVEKDKLFCRDCEQLDPPTCRLDISLDISGDVARGPGPARSSRRVVERTFSLWLDTRWGRQSV